MARILRVTSGCPFAVTGKLSWVRAKKRGEKAAAASDLSAPAAILHFDVGQAFILRVMGTATILQTCSSKGKAFCTVQRLMGIAIRSSSSE